MGGHLVPRAPVDDEGVLGAESARTEFTSEEERGSGQVRRALREGAGKVVVVGGDGSISEALQGFFENGGAIAPEASLVVMPAGRGDDFFKSLAGWDAIGGEAATRRALEVIRRGNPRPTDVGAIEWLGARGEALGQKRSILLANHGQLCACATMEEAAVMSVFIERAARAQLLARAVGEIRPIDPGHAKEAHDYRLKPKAVGATFHYFARRVLKESAEKFL